MNLIYEDLLKTVKGLPENPFAHKTVLIPAQRLEKEVEVANTNELGEEVITIEKQSYLATLPAFSQIESLCVENRIDYQLTEFAPQKDIDGNPCVFVINKPSFLLTKQPIGNK